MQTRKINQETEHVRYLLDKIKIEASHVLPTHLLTNAQLGVREDFATRSLIYTLSSYLVGKEHLEKNIKIVKYPADWWEHFKVRFFHRSLLKKYPVKYKEIKVAQTITITNICPHLPVPNDDRNHIEYVIMETLKCKPGNSSRDQDH